MYRLFFIFVGLLIFEGSTGLPTSENDDIKIRSVVNKPNIHSRRMIRGKKRDETNHPEYKSNDRVQNPEYKSNDRVENLEYPFNDRFQNSEYKSNDKSMDKAMDSVIVAINAGVKSFMASENKSDFIGKLAKTLVDYLKDNQKDTVYRSMAEGYVKPGIIHFKQDKPSLMLEVNSKSIINGVHDFLKSKLVRRLMQHYSKEAAMAYGSLKNEWNKQGDRYADDQP